MNQFLLFCRLQHENTHIISTIYFTYTAMLDYLNLQQTVGRRITVKGHTSALLGHLYTSRANADLTVTVSDARANSSVSTSSSFRCHGAVLAAVSGYFESLLHFNCITSPTSSSSEQTSHTVTTSSHTGEVSLVNINCNTFEKVLEFAYTGTVNISQHTAVDILKAADFLQVFTALPFE